MNYIGLTEKDILAQGFVYLERFRTTTKIYGKNEIRLFIGQDGKVTLEYKR